jgi:AcrR family transcriptional regulator
VATMQPTVQPLRRDAAANRERLIVAAIEVFNDDGIDAGVEQIAQRAGVGIGTLYRRFPTKEALIAHLVDELLSEMIIAADDALNVADGHGLEQYVRAMGDQLSRHRGCLSRLWGGGDLARIEELRARQYTLLLIAQQAGVIRADIGPTDLTILLWSLRGIVESSGAAAQQACRRYLDLTFAGLRPGTAELTTTPLTARQLSS